MIKADARRIVMTLFSGYASQLGRKSTEDMSLSLEAYVIGLEDLTVEDARAAVARALRTSKWLPTIAELRANVVNAASGGEKQGAEAWLEVLRAVSRYGVYRAPGADFVFPDAVTQHLITAQWWREICNGDGDNVRADRARFIDAYDRIRLANRVNSAASAGARILPMPARADGAISIGDAIKRQLDTGKPCDDDSK